MSKWLWVPLADLIEVNPSRTLKKGVVYPYVAMEDVSIEFPNLKSHSFRSWDGSGSRFQKGDVLLARITPSAENGKTAIVTLDMGYGSTELTVLAPKDTGILESRFLFYILKDSYIRNQLIDQMTGTTGRQRIPNDSFDNVLIPLPPLPVQRRIAAILGSVDELIRNIESSIAQILSLEVAILNQFVNRFLKTSDIIGLGSVCEVRSGITKGRVLPNNTLVIDAPYLRVANVQDGFLDLREIKTIPVLPQEISEYKLEPGDLVLTEGGDLDKLGRGTLWEGQIPDCAFQNHIFRVRVRDRQKIYPEFLALLIRSNYGKTYFLNCAKRTTNLASINSTQLKHFPVLLPSNAEQTNLIETVNRLRAVYNNQKSHVDGLRSLKTSLLSNLLSNPTRFDSMVSTL